LDVTSSPSDVIAHAELDFGTGKTTLSDAMKDYCLIAADPSHGANFSLALYVPDPDQLVERCRRAPPSASGSPPSSPEIATPR
jgi:PhnB protein